VRLEGGNETAGQGQFLTRILAQYPAILDLATYLSLNKLLGVIRASHCRFRRVSFDYPLGNEADWSQ
jgi:hypothetical protein